MQEINVKERLDKVFFIVNGEFGNELSPVKLFYNVSYGDYYSTTRQNLVDAVMTGAGFCRHTYDHNGNAKSFSVLKGDNAKNFGNAINEGPKVKVYLEVSSLYFDSIGADGIKSFSFCVKHIISCLPKYLRCLLSKKDHQVNKSSLKNLFNDELLNPDNVYTKPGYYQLDTDNGALISTNDNENAYFCNAINHGKKGYIPTNYKEMIGFGNNLIAVDSITPLLHSKLKKYDKFNYERNVLIPMLEIKFSEESGRSGYSILHFSELVSTLFKATIMSVCPYVTTTDKKLDILQNEEVIKFLPLGLSLKDRRHKLIEILNNDFRATLTRHEEIGNMRDSLNNYCGMLSEGLVFNRIFRERIDYHVENIRFVPTVLIAKKFRRIK